MYTGRNNRSNHIQIFDTCMEWIHQNTIEKCGIAITSKQLSVYPEVTGYYIPTLLMWGEHDLAASYAKYLCSIQKQDGSWYDSTNRAPYVFDSAQILKGLISIRKILPEVDTNIRNGCEWLLSNIQGSGRMTTPSSGAWGADESFCSELIHLYCLTPLRDAGKIFSNPEYIEAANRVLAYYKRTEINKIKNFSLLSHFYAYVIEGLFDMGETALARECMENLLKYQGRKGSIPGLKDVHWVCSTGLFQLALVWYKLNELEKGNKIFEYACSLQNRSGGWYGSYPASAFLNGFCHGKKKACYFPKEEISWANKYFLDALARKEHLEFEKMAPVFSDEIDEKDGRLALIARYLEMRGSGLRVCDIGCGKGRYLKKLSCTYPANEYYAMDISATVMEGICCVKEKRIGCLTQIPWPDAFFDFVYVCEALEHAINLKGALRELYRAVKPGGLIIIIDKPVEQLGKLKIDAWEQWIDDADIRNFTEGAGGRLEIERSVPYEGRDDGLFRSWIITKKQRNT